MLQETIAKAKAAFLDFLTTLNLLGSALLAYALDNQAIVDEFLPFLPDSFAPYAPVLGGVWFVTVQYAKLRLAKKAVEASA